MKTLLSLAVLVCKIHVEECSSVVVRSTCTLESNQKWNSRNIKDNLKLWWNSLTSVFGDEGQIGPSMLLFDKDRRTYNEHCSGSPNYRDNLLTLTRHDLKDFSGLTWQRSDADPTSGFLYGYTDKHGIFTGKDILYIYPDFETGIYGSFVDGQLEEGVEAKITAERCSGGMKELKFKLKNEENVWFQDVSNDTYIGRFPTRMDPYERKSVYIGESIVVEGGEGVFAKRDFLPGEIVSYFNGIKTYSERFLWENLTEAEYWESHSYFIELSQFSQERWQVPEETVIDIPREYRNVTKYRTTLCHKVNHQFAGINTEFCGTLHPLFGPISCIRAIQPIERGEEVFVNYGYVLEYSPPWYMKAYRQYILNRNREYILKRVHHQQKQRVHPRRQGR